jgi:hypothetical protein
MQRIIKILMERDELSHEDAELQVSAFFSEMALDLNQGGDPFEWETLFVDEFGLEPDFFRRFSVCISLKISLLYYYD